MGEMDGWYAQECIPAEARLFAESDAWRRSVLAAHFPGVPIFDDVRDVATSDISARPGGVGVGGGAMGGGCRDGSDHVRRPGVSGPRPDLVCGGFPCQDLSVAGQRRGLAGDRSGLFFEFARILDTVRPRWVLLENVPGLLSSNDGRDMGTVVGTLADLGYGVGWRVLDARHFGVPQRRRRVFIVGRLGDDGGSALRCLCEGCEGSAETRDCSWQETALRIAEGTGGDGVARSLTKRHAGSNTARDGVDNLVVSTLQAAGGDRGWRTDAEGAAGGHLVVEQDVAHALLGLHKRDDPSNETFVSFHQTQDPISHEDGSTPAMGRTSIGMGIASAARVRRLTPVECERLMGWPDGWTAPVGIKAPDSKRYAACGDGVVAHVSEWIGRRILVEDAR